MTDEIDRLRAEVKQLRANQKELLEAIEKARRFLNKLAPCIIWLPSLPDVAPDVAPAPDAK